MNKEDKIKELENKLEELHTELNELKLEKKSRRIIKNPMNEQEFRKNLHQLKDKESITVVTSNNEVYTASAGMKIGFCKCKTLESAGTCLYGFIISVGETVSEVY